MVLLVRDHASCCSKGIGHLGHQHPGRLGLRHHQLRLVDRHRPRRHADLGDPAAAAPGVAHLDQPLRRGDDALRRGLRRAVPAAPHWAGPWLAYWLLPYPNTMGIWPQFRSPLIWDVFAVSTYATVSLLFWYVGLIPDLATLRDRAQERSGRRSSTASLAMGWRGSARHWHRYETAYLLLAGLATPLVSRCTRSSASTSPSAVVPGWHATIFPPYFVAGADLRRLRDGADAGDPAAQASTASRTSSPCAPRQHGAR